MSLTENHRPHSNQLRAAKCCARFVLYTQSILLSKGEFNVR